MKDDSYKKKLHKEILNNEFVKKHVEKILNTTIDDNFKNFTQAEPLIEQLIHSGGEAVLQAVLDHQSEHLKEKQKEKSFEQWLNENHPSHENTVKNLSEQDRNNYEATDRDWETA